MDEAFNKHAEAVISQAFITKVTGTMLGLFDEVADRTELRALLLGQVKCLKGAGFLPQHCLPKVLYQKNYGSCSYKSFSAQHVEGDSSTNVAHMVDVGQKPKTRLRNMTLVISQGNFRKSICALETIPADACSLFDKIWLHTAGALGATTKMGCHSTSCWTQQ
eukprot:5756959-Amphidinium_carterae.1